MIIGAMIVLMIWLWATVPHIPKAEFGRRTAEEYGCFGCHGPGGIQGVPNPGRADLTVPSFTGDLMMFASSREDIHSWIENGFTPGREKSASWHQERQKGALKMPAFGHKLSRKEINNLVAYVEAVNGWNRPQDSLALLGMNRADSLGCFGCHGPGGRLARQNPKSFKGYIASWSTEDFPELVENRGEFDEWVTNGAANRIVNNPLGRYFLKRATIKMPPFKDHLRPGDLDALWAYVQWLRSNPQN